MAKPKKTRKTKSSVKVQDMSPKKNAKGGRGATYSKLEFSIKK